MEEKILQSPALDVAGYLLKEAFIEIFSYALHVVFKRKNNIDQKSCGALRIKMKYEHYLSSY